MGSPGAGKATTVTIRFLDDEIMEGRVASTSLDQPNLELEMLDQASNNERALIPLPSIKRIALGSGVPTAAEQARAGKKVAIRFQDGEVLKGYLDGDLMHATYGVTLRLISRQLVGFERAFSRQLSGRGAGDAGYCERIPR